MRAILTIALCALVLAGCDNPAPTGEQLQNQQQQIATKQAVQSVGFPSITHYFEKRQLKTILELRDRAISTVTYLQDMQGHLHKLCDSVGYGIPYATQYTNPQQVEHHSDTYGGNIAVSQADPNGLYSPPDAAGTWVLCLDPLTKRTTPVYSEPNVVVSPFALQSE